MVDVNGECEWERFDSGHEDGIDDWQKGWLGADSGEWAVCTLACGMAGTYIILHLCVDLLLSGWTAWHLGPWGGSNYFTCRTLPARSFAAELRATHRCCSFLPLDVHYTSQVHTTSVSRIWGRYIVQRQYDHQGKVQKLKTVPLGRYSLELRYINLLEFNLFFTFLLSCYSSL